MVGDDDEVNILQASITYPVNTRDGMGDGAVNLTGDGASAKQLGRRGSMKMGQAVQLPVVDDFNG